MRQKAVADATFLHSFHRLLLAGTPTTVEKVSKYCAFVLKGRAISAAKTNTTGPHFPGAAVNPVSLPGKAGANDVVGLLKIGMLYMIWFNTCCSEAIRVYYF